MRLREYAAASALIAVAAAGCGGVSGSHATLRVNDAAGGAAVSGQGVGKAIVPASPDLKLALSAASGAPGTVVQIKATGCVDPNGLNHAVSYNAGNRSAGRAPNAIRAIPARLSGTVLTASYTITTADRGAAHGMFYVQCGTTVVSTPFRVTR